MKKFILLSLLIVTISSCDKDLLDVSFSSNLSQTSEPIIINSPSINSPSVKNPLQAYETTFVVDLENPDTKDYLNKIKDIDLENVRIAFQGLDGLAGNTTPTVLKITVNNQLVLEFNDFKYSDVANGQEFAIEDTQKIKEMASLLFSTKKLTIKVEGNIPDTAMYQFYIKFMAKANITASAL